MPFGPHGYVNVYKAPDSPATFCGTGISLRSTADSLAAWCGYRRIGIWRVYLKAPK